MAYHGPNFTLTPLPYGPDGARVRFDCQECGHTEEYGRLKYDDVAHVLGNDHYWGRCPEVRWRGESDPDSAAHRARMRQRYLITA